MEDKDIIDLYWKRSEQAIRESSDKYGAYCFSIANRILGFREDAEECVNDTWLHAWNAMPPGRPEKLSVFLGKITRNLAINLYEKLHAAKRRGSTADAALDELSECIPDSHTVEEEFNRELLTNQINHFLKGLKPESRKMFVQRYWYMLSIREIADQSGFSESKVKMSLLRIRNSLRNHLEKEGFTI